MSYTLRVHFPEAEPYTDLLTEGDVEEAVSQEVWSTINDLGSDILDTGSEEEREEKSLELTKAAMADLWVNSDEPTKHRLPGPVADNLTGRRRPGVLLSLEEAA